MLQGLGDDLKHILKRAYAGKYHGEIENYRKESPERDILQNGRQSNKQQPRTRADVELIGEAGGDDDERRDDGGNRIKERGVLRHADHVLLL